MARSGTFINNNPQSIQLFYAFGTGNAYAVYGLTAGSNLVYDANGNIKNLSRKGANGEVIDAFTYNYYTGLNQLKSVTDASGYTAGTTDLKTQPDLNYQYNQIGQMTHNVEDGHYFTYDVYGKTKTIYNNISFADNAKLAIYEYDDRGFRVKKFDHNTNTTTWYVRDVSGNMITTFTKENTATLQRTEVPVYGSGRLGMATCNATGSITAYTYELTDHLGNVRVTVGKNATNGTTQLLTATDYFPFGMELPGRTYRSTNAYRFGYQGQFAEKDQETGYNAFELRLYDARIGRFPNPDPYHQYWSLYMAMGNNPVNTVDPNGGIGIFKKNPVTNSDYKPTGNVIGQVNVYAESKTAWSNFTSLFSSLGRNIPGIEFRSKTTSIDEIVRKVNVSTPTITMDYEDFMDVLEMLPYLSKAKTFSKIILIIIIKEISLQKRWEMQ